MFQQALVEQNCIQVLTPLHHPHMNGRVERFKRTLLEEWAHVRPYTSYAIRFWSDVKCEGIGHASGELADDQRLTDGFAVTVEPTQLVSGRQKTDRTIGAGDLTSTRGAERHCGDR